jgi:3-hydroxybutyryl-CoA dehydratase
MSDFYVKVGDVARFSKTVSESDVYLFAGITGDFAPNHVNRAVMEKSSYRKPIAHGALMVGFMSATSTMIIANKDWNASGETPVSLGYDRVRFLAPVFYGDTINVQYTISAIDPAKRRATGDIAITNQEGTLVAVATHILKWVKND